jgi:hypothetical protein
MRRDRRAKGPKGPKGPKANDSRVGPLCHAVPRLAVYVNELATGMVVHHAGAYKWRIFDMISRHSGNRRFH